MSKVLAPQSHSAQGECATPANKSSAASANVRPTSSRSSISSQLTVDFDDFTSSSSILEFLAKEQECCADVDAESIFKEVSRLSDSTDTRSLDEILREAELLLQQQQLLGSSAAGHQSNEQNRRQSKQQTVSPALSSVPLVQGIKMNAKYTKRIETVCPQTPTKSKKLLNGISDTVSDLSNALKHNMNVIDSNVTESTAATPTPTATPMTPQSCTPLGGGEHFEAFIDNLPSVSVISEESTPKDMLKLTEAEGDVTTTAQLSRNDDDTDDGTDTMEEITEGIETIEIMVNDVPPLSPQHHSIEPLPNDGVYMSMSSSHVMSSSMRTLPTQPQPQMKCNSASNLLHRRPSCDGLLQQQPAPHIPSHTFAYPTMLGRSPYTVCPSPLERRSSATGQRSASMTTPDSGISQTHSSQSPGPYSSHNSSTHSTPAKKYCDKAVNSSPKHVASALTSPIEPLNMVSREHALKHEIEQLQEKFKDTEERLQSLRIQHDSLSQLHRDLRENNTHLQEEADALKLDVRHLNECANILRNELQTARNDRSEALELQKVLQSELEEHRHDKKRAQEQKEKDAKTIQDLQRQCREMERILVRKHPDSVSALIVASKNPGKNSMNDQENHSSRKLLEQRIAQLEADAKEQDLKAQQILANVQARFNSVQAKYETHIADLETQVLSLQEINTKLNEKIESQVRTLDYFIAKKAEKYYNNCTQTDPLPQPYHADDITSTSCTSIAMGYDTISSTTVCINGGMAVKNTSTMGTQTATALRNMRDHSTNTIGTSAPHSASSSTSSTANSTPNTSRPNSKQSGIRKPTATALGSKLPVSQSDMTISLSAHHASAKEDAHLLATLRGMRVDLAIKDKAVQRLTRELDECKKTIRKLQREKDAVKAQPEKSLWSSFSAAASSRRSNTDIAHSSAADQTESQALKEAQNKVKLLEADYKQLHEKRLQDLKTLQTAHERELASCHETVRILQQRLNERDEAFALQKRRKLPVDYYALKAKVSSLERRHSEREERLHMLVEALSKGRLNGALDELLADNNNQ